MAKLTKLYVENFKRIQVVGIEPKGYVTIISGMNEQGKSSLLDSISVLLQGKAAKIPAPVRKGAKKAKITSEIVSDSWDAFDDMIITRTITATGNWYIKVQNKSGKSFKSPEGMLKKIFGEPVDPCEFVRMTAKERIETLKRITGLDFSELDVRRKELYNERMLIGREVKNKQGALNNMEVYPDAPENELSLSELVQELEDRQEINRQNDEKQWELKRVENTIFDIDNKINRLKKELEEIKNKLYKAENDRKRLIVTKENLEDDVNNLEYANTDEIKKQIEDVELVNAQIRANLAFNKESEKLKKLKEKQMSLTRQIEEIDNQKRQQLANIKFPIDGLSFGDNDVLYNGLPFDSKQLSSEELLRISFSIAIAARPNLKNILIREGSLLDDNNLKLIAQMAEESGIHVFIETVGNNADKATLIIANGKIAKSVPASKIDEDEDCFDDI